MYNIYGRTTVYNNTFLTVCLMRFPPILNVLLPKNKILK